MKQGTIHFADEAFQRIEQVADPVTRSLVQMAFTHIVKKTHLDRGDPPRCDLDGLFLVRALEEFLSEHDVIARTLEGERVGAWFDEDA